MTQAVTVVANCHCLPLADAFALCSPNVMTDFIDVNFASMPIFIEKIEALASGDQLVFTQPISATHGLLATQALRGRLGTQAVLTFTNVHFAGLHPDITYLGAMGSRKPSFFGDYHSKLALFAFVTRRSLAECFYLFAMSTYEAVGYFDAFDQSAAELRLREETCDIRFAETFLGMVREQPTLFTMNHPSSAVFLELAGALARHAGLAYRKMESPFFLNHLANSYIWPIYNEIAEHNGLAYRTPPYFVNLASRSSRSYSLQEFLAGCYAAYAATDFTELATVVSQAPFFKLFATKIGV